MLPAIAFSQSFLSEYKGLPYHDSRVSGGAQKIPGRVLCAYHDLGGEGVAYHDSDPQNHGSGELNPADGTYLNEFRIHEGVDISYTKFNRKPDPIDDNPFDKVVPPADLLYVGWTEPGEWFSITVNVTETGTYAERVLFLLLSFPGVLGRAPVRIVASEPERQHKQDRAQEDWIFLHVNYPFDTPGPILSGGVRFL
jgi:hypothetical protein